MKVIRKSVFETNSSSMHSIAVPKEYFNGVVTKNYTPSGGSISSTVTLEGFYWSDNIYTDASTKLCYALTQLYEQALAKLYHDDVDCDDFTEEMILNTMKEFDMYKDIELIVKDVTGEELQIKDIMDSYCGIDHQSICEDFYKLLEDNNITLRQFIFDEEISLIIDDDNSGTFSDYRDNKRSKGFKIIYTNGYSYHE